MASQLCVLAIARPQSLFPWRFTYSSTFQALCYLLQVIMLCKLLRVPREQILIKPQQKSLDIGVASLLNLRWISRARLIAYTLLPFSSMPLLLLQVFVGFMSPIFFWCTRRYNSVLSQSLPTIEHPIVFIVTPEIHRSFTGYTWWLSSLLLSNRRPEYCRSTQHRQAI